MWFRKHQESVHITSAVLNRPVSLSSAFDTTVETDLDRRREFDS